jgi:hypothetical protein
MARQLPVEVSHDNRADVFLGVGVDPVLEDLALLHEHSAGRLGGREILLVAASFQVHGQRTEFGSLVSESNHDPFPGRSARRSGFGQAQFRKVAQAAIALFRQVEFFFLCVGRKKTVSWISL